MARARRKLTAHLRYAWALLKRFKITFLMLGILFGVMPLVFMSRYVGNDGRRLAFGEALHHVYFLLFGEPTLPYVDSLLIEVLNLLIPPLGIAVVADGVVRFAYLFFAKHRSDKEWIEVISQTLKDHVIVCGAGRVGYRVVSQLLHLDKELVVIEKNENAAFVRVLRDMEVAVLIDDVKSPSSLKRLNAQHASALVCATDDDLANLNVALDARRINPNIRLVIRLFDDDLVTRVRDTFHAEAFSTSALASPALALAALDPRIVHSFQVGGHLMVVSHFVAGAALSGMTLTEVRDRFGGITLSIRRPDGGEELHPSEGTRISNGDVLTIQGLYGDYQSLRAYAGEGQPPSYGHALR